jgi:hypothetical protein
MTASGCETCRWRARYDAAPTSWLGRLWRWHARWCPGWRSYMASLPETDRRRLAEKYGLLQCGRP